MARPFKADHRQRRSCFFSIQYITIVGEDIEPMPWQQSDYSSEPLSRPLDHARLSSCSSIVALSLSGGPVKRLRNNVRRDQGQFGFVHDPWAPWHVLSIQCYPDDQHSISVHNSTRNYVNGPEAFLNTLLAEYQDASKRYEEIYKAISKVVVPPVSLTLRIISYKQIQRYFLINTHSSLSYSMAVCAISYYSKMSS
jgi:hypothetical protein